VAARTQKTDTQQNRKGREQAVRVSIFLTLLAVIAISCFFGFRYVANALFAGNGRFILQRIEFNSSGWWDGKNKLVAEKLGLTIGRDNLFSLNLGELRQKLLKRIANLETVSVMRILPDTLTINAVERIPRAFIANNRSNWVVDEKAVILNRKYCNNVNQDMPVILGLDNKNSIVEGMDLPDILPALELIMLAVRNFPELKISAVSIRNQEQLTVKLQYKERPYEAVMPRKKLNFLLVVLQSAIVQAQTSGDTRCSINLNYNGNAVLK
jgi:hypothetical protein